MRFLIVSKSPFSVGLCQRLQLEGHIATRCCLEPKYEMCGEGFITNQVKSNMFAAAEEKTPVKVIEKVIPQVMPDCVVFDFAADATLTMPFRNAGWKVIGGHHNYIMDTDVLPPQIRLCGWWDGQTFSHLKAISIYEKCLAGDCGPSIPYVGCLVEPAPQTQDYSGYFQNSEMLGGSMFPGPYLLETIIANTKNLLIRPLFQFGFPAYAELIKGGTSALFLSVCNGETSTIETKEGSAVSILCTLPPFPFEGLLPATKTQHSFGGLNPSNVKHLWFYDVGCREGMVSVGDNSTLCFEVSAYGENSENGTASKEARKRIFRTLGRIKIDNLQYRNDVGSWNLARF
jgi:hypothetical protein